jgi:fructokinase
MPHTIVAYGELLWDLLPGGARLGGAPFNFVYRVNCLGDRGIMISRVGIDDLGRRALQAVAGLGMETGYIQTDGEHSTGTVKVSFDRKRNPDFTILPDAAYDFIEPEAGLRELAGRADCLCFGTLIQRREVSRNTFGELIAAFRGSFALLDINLRRDCWSRQSVLGSIERADILKLNEEEARLVAGLYGRPTGGPVGREKADLPVLADRLLERTALQMVLITLGDRGSFAATREGRKAYHPAFLAKLKDPIGSGDAFTAGFLHALLGTGSLEEACRYGNALGAMVAAQEGATQPLDLAEIETFLARAAPGPIDSGLEEYRI